MAHVLLSEVVDVIAAQYGEEPDSYVYGVSRTLVVSHAKRVLQELSYAGMRSLRVAVSEVYASGKVELPDDYVEYVKVYYCVGNYLVPAFWNPHINTAQWEGLKDFEEEVIQTETGRTIYTESGDYLTVMVRSEEGVKDYGDLYCNCFLKGYKYDGRSNCFVFDYVPEGVTHVAIEYVADPLISEPNPDNLSVHKYFQKAIEAGVYLRLVETRRNVPMNEKVRAKREWNIKYKDAVKELNGKPWEYVQVIMGWRHMRKCGFEGMGGQSVPLKVVERADYTGRYDEFVCQRREVAEYRGRYDGYVCQKAEGDDGMGYVVSVTTPEPHVELRIVSSASEEVSVDWGDGVVESKFVAADVAEKFAHDYVSGEESHVIGIRGRIVVLYCDNEDVISLDVSQNPKLTLLSCSPSLLTTLDVSRNPELDTLYCNYSRLTSLVVSENKKLTVLGCESNELTVLDVSHNPELDFLYCGANKLDSLDVSENLKMTHLYCERNRLASLDIGRNAALTNLGCEANELTSLDVSHNRALTNLFCGANLLTFLDVSHNDKLSNISCGRNQLATLDVSHNPKLVNLMCENNQLTFLDITQNPGLTSLNCGNNPLAEDEEALVLLASSLPDRTGETRGVLNVGADNPLKDVIAGICNEKNWELY